jgi:hypothetical protein
MAGFDSTPLRPPDAIAQRGRFEGQQLKQMGRAATVPIDRQPLYHCAGGKQKNIQLRIESKWSRLVS